MVRLGDGASLDPERVRDVYLASFPPDEAPRVARLAVELLECKSAWDVLAFAAFAPRRTGADEHLVGHVVFSIARFGSTGAVCGYLLSPLAVAPDSQGQGIGSRLVRHGLDQLAGSGASVALVYGDPAFYGRFGFSAEQAAATPAPYPLEFPFGWQAVALGGRSPVGSGGAVRCLAPLDDPELW